MIITSVVHKPVDTNQTDLIEVQAKRIPKCISGRHPPHANPSPLSTGWLIHFNNGTQRRNPYRKVPFPEMRNPRPPCATCRPKFRCPLNGKVSGRFGRVGWRANQTDSNRRKEPINELPKPIAARTSMNGERNLFIKNYFYAGG